MTTLANLDIDTADLPALHHAAALEEGACPGCPECPPTIEELQVTVDSGGKPKGLVTKRFTDWFFDSDEPLGDMQTRGCNGTGTVPLLDAGLVREPCPLCGGQGLLEGPCDCENPPNIEHHLVQCHGCQGRGWVATRNTWQYWQAFASPSSRLDWNRLSTGGYSVSLYHSEGITPWFKAETLELATMRAIAHALRSMVDI